MTFVYLILCIIGMVFNTILANTIELPEMEAWSWRYFLWILGGLLAGMGIATFPMIINVMFWHDKSEAGAS